MIYRSFDAEKSAILDTANRMCAAARTAPKGRGVDNLVTMVVTGEEKDMLANEMDIIGKREDVAFFIRDAQNVRDSEAVVLLGTRLSQRGVPFCGYCGFENCAKSKSGGGICSFDVNDLGVALGSAAGVAADCRVDSRVMFSIGKAAIALNVFDEDVKIVYGIPLSVSGKSVFFDRK